MIRRRSNLRVPASRIGAIAALMTLAVAHQMPATAFDQRSMGTIGPKKPYLEKSFGPIAGLYPVREGAHPFAGFRPPACRSVNYCDSVEIEVDFPPTYAKEVFFGMTITLEWANPYHKDKNPTGNDVDMFLWPDDGEAAGGPSSKCGSPATDECDNIYPEVITITEPDRTIQDPDVAIFLTIVNHEGVNSGYKLTAQWFTFDLEPPPAFKPPDREVSSEPGVYGPFQFDVTESTGGNVDAGPKATPRKILVPGPDGQPVEVDLPLYAAGNRILADDSGFNTWIPAAVVGALVLGGLSWFLVRRSRQRREA